MLQRGFVGTQVLDLLLGQIAGVQRTGTGQLAGKRGKLADQGADEGGLAGAVAPQDADAGTAPHDELGQGDDGLPGRVAAGQMVGADQRIRSLGGLGEFEVDAACGAQRRDGLHALQGLQAALRLAGLGGLGAETRDEAVEVLDAGLLVAAGTLALGSALGADVLAGGVAAGVALKPAVLDDQAGVGHAVKEVAIVRDDELDGRMAQQLALQPQHGVQVQVVGGFVQQQQVAGGHQHAGQVQAHLPAAREFVHRACQLRLPEAQTVQQFGSAGLGGRSAGIDPAGIGLAQRLAVVAGLGLLDGLFGGHQGSIGVHHEAYRVDAGARRMLGQPGDAQPGQVNVALFRSEIATQQCQQRALAAAVGADEGDALTRVDDERGVRKEGAPGAGQAEVVEADQGRARSVSGRQKAGPRRPASP